MIPAAARLTRPMGSVVTALALTLILAALAPVAAASPTLVRLSSDPFTNTTSQHATEVEPDTLSSGSTIVSAFQVGRFFDGGASDIGFATSHDNGVTWTNGFLPGATPFSTPAGPYQRTSDASVAFDARDGVWLISYLGIINPTGPVDVVVSRSTDGGLTWGSPVVVNATGHFDDKNWTTCDTTPTSPFYGNCYTEFDDATQGDLEQMSTSTDGGLTWSAALPTASNVHGIGGQPLVQPNGNVVVPFVSFNGQNFFIASFTSANGGASWGKTHIVARVGFHHAAGGIRDSIPLPSAEIDGAGKVYVVWQDCHFEPTCAASDLLMSTSTDGAKWSKLTRIPLDPIGSGVDHFFPGLAVDRTTSGDTAHLVVTFYQYPVSNCTASTCQLEVAAASSADGGASWSAKTQLAGPMSLSWLPNTTQGTMVGDYISTSFAASGNAFPAFAVATAPAGDTFDEATFTVGGGLAVGGAAVDATDQSAAGANATLTPGSITDQ